LETQQGLEQIAMVVSRSIIEKNQTNYLTTEE
jgi:hypothetical protein